MQWTEDPPEVDFPDLGKESYEKVLELVKVWDAKGLVDFKPSPASSDWKHYGDIRFFNCFKAPGVGGVIGDRRLRNWKEGKLPGPSRSLPTAMQLASLEVDPTSQRCSIFISDRRDFYHQFKIPWQRSQTNALWPPLQTSDVRDLNSFTKFLERSKPKKYIRSLDGDRFGLNPSCAARQLPSQVQAVFASIPQGDHLGVELATSAHRGFLQFVMRKTSSLTAHGAESQLPRDLSLMTSMQCPLKRPLCLPSVRSHHMKLLRLRLSG